MQTKLAIFFVLSCAMLFHVCALDNGLGRTPQMGWNSWNLFACNINESLIRNTAKAFIDSGLAKVGYTYVNMDDCWATSRNSSGYVQADPVKFPSGIKALADYVHSLGLKYGLYSDAGNFTCGGRPGSLYYETEDATQYAQWGVDYLKYDNCYNDGLPDEPRYTAMRDALNKTGRSIFFSMCDWVSTTAAWGARVGNSWRTTTDINNYFESWTHNLDQTNLLAKYAGPGGWNDPDMLEVGNGLSDNENVAHFSLWALIKAPLLLGNDIVNMKDDVIEVLTNTEVIGVSQDKLGKQGFRMWHDISSKPSLTSNTLYVDKCQGLPSQTWAYDPVSGNIQSKYLPNNCVGQWVPTWNCGEFTTRGDTLYVMECGVLCNGTRQVWTLKDGTLMTSFKDFDTQLCVEVVEGVHDEVQLAWDCTGAQNQAWKMGSDGTIRNGNGKCLTIGGGREVWAGPLADGSTAVVLFNRASASQTISVDWTTLGLSGTFSVRDLWAHQELGKFTNTFSTSVGARGAVMIKVTKA